MKILRFTLVLLLCACAGKKTPVPKIIGLEGDAQTQAFLQSVLEANKNANIEDIMRARGYYHAKVKQSQAEITITPGEVTTIKSISIKPEKYRNRLKGLKPGDPLNADKVIAAENNLLKSIEKDSCAFNLSIDHVVIIDNNKTAQLTITINEGTQATQGPATFTGAKDVEQKHLIKHAKWEEDTCFKRQNIRKTRKNLLSTGLFANIDVKIAEKPDEMGKVPVEFILTEAKHRTVRAGLSYYTDEGPGIIVGWEHRNHSGQGETLKTELRANLLEQTLEGQNIKHYFHRDDQTLNLHANLTREDTDAYESLGTRAGFHLSREVTQALNASLGADLDFSRITEDGEEGEDFLILSPSAAMSYDTRDNRLDPQKGVLLRASLAPAFDMLGQSDPYFKTEISGRAFYQAHEKITLATRLKLGAVLGASSDDLPATERFFAGGGGSVRGFGYQDVGPIDADGDPEGGRSITEGASEIRFKASEKIGGVLFLDYAQISETTAPKVNDLSFGAGAGLRYFTDFGPIRFDVGTPLNNDENADHTIQFYISIGQAF